MNPRSVQYHRVASLLPPGGSNKMSCFPCGPLMPLRASFRTSSMCHSETVASDTNQLVDLEINTRQQVPLRPTWMGKPRREDDIETSPCVFATLLLFFSPPTHTHTHALLTLSNRRRPQVHAAAGCHRATKRVLKRVPHEPSLSQPGGRALDPDLFK